MESLHYTSAQHCGTNVAAQDLYFTMFASDHDRIPTDDITKPHFRQTIKPNSV